MKEFNKFQNENFEKDVIIVEQTKHEVEERPRAERPKHGVEEISRVERPKHEVEERSRVERPKHEVEERPRVERPKHEVEERPRAERPKHEVEERSRVERPKHEVEERPKSVEGKINYIINFNVDKTQLLELKKILVELEFYEIGERKEILENVKRKIRRR